jgi:hypothetical protein
VSPRRRPRSLNEQLLDDLLRHASLLPQFEDEQIRQLVRMLDQTHAELGEKIRARLRRLIGEGQPTVDNPTVTALRRLLREIQAILVQVYRRAGRRLTRELKLFAREEADFFLRSLGRLTDATAGRVAIHELAFEVLEALVERDPLGARPLAGWFEDLATNEVRRIRNAIEQGVLQGESMSSIVRRLYGTRGETKKGAIIFESRRHLETVVRSAVQGVSARVQMKTLEANRDVVKAVRWLATLDKDTCEICFSRDGHVYDPLTFAPLDPSTMRTIPDSEIAANPGKWPSWGAGPAEIHLRCRCQPNFIIKSLAELGINLPQTEVVGERAATTPDQRVNGTVPGNTTYPDWLRSQPRWVVDQILGEKRAALFLAGRLEFADLFEPTGEFLTLGELRQRFGAILDDAA